MANGGGTRDQLLLAKILYDSRFRLSNVMTETGRLPESDRGSTGTMKTGEWYSLTSLLEIASVFAMESYHRGQNI